MLSAIEEKFIEQLPVVVIDTETTGLFPGLGHRIVEVAAVRLENWQTVDQMNQLVQPGRSMEPRASEVSGITDEMLIGAPSFAQVADRLLELAEGALLVAHNARFDAAFLGLELSIAASTPAPADHADNQARLSNLWLCTLQLARRHFYFGRNNLGHIARHLGVRMGRAHRALNDVYMTAEVLKRMTVDLRRRRMATVGDLLHAQGGPIYTPPQPDIILPEPLRAAVLEGQPVRILYLGDNGENYHLITPLYPAQHHDTNYLIAYCHHAQDQRTFRLDRIFSAHRLA